MNSSDFNINEYIMHHITDSDYWNIFGINIHLPDWLSLHKLMILFTMGLLILLFCFIYNKKNKVPSGITNLLESFIIFIRNNIIKSNISNEKYVYELLPFFCTLFFFILFINLLGLIPLFATATSNINVTAALALIVLIKLIYTGISKKGFLGFFKSFIPSGIHPIFKFLLFPIEIIGLFIKIFSLTIRLCANLMAGHIIIIALLSLIVLFGVVGFPAIILTLMIYCIELLVAFLQAYIFTLLSAVFLGHILNDH